MTNNADEPSSGRIERNQTTVVLPAEGAPPCPQCGGKRVAIWRDGIDRLIDNMGCELGLEYVAGPLCPKCEETEVAASKRSPVAR